MKRKLLAALLAAGMAISLCACGNQGASGAPQPTTSPTISDDDVTNAPETPTSDNWQDEDSETSNEENTPDITQDVPGETDTPAPEPEVSKPEGLILMTVDMAETSSNKMSHIIISSIDPDTGFSQEISNFKFGRIIENLVVRGIYNTPCASDGMTLGTGYYVTRREWFNADYTKMAITWLDETLTEYHAGWVDQENSFFDVTVALGLQRKSDFDAPTHHEAIGFTEDGQFLFRSLTGDQLDAHYEYFYVPLDDLRADAICSGLPLLGENIEDYGSHRIKISDVGGSGAYLTNEENDVGLFHDASGESVAYIPATSRLCWNAVFSPDENQIAFMSKLKDGGPVDIYTMALANGDPTKVVMDGFDMPTLSEDRMRGYYISGAPCSMLIDWR